MFTYVVHHLNHWIFSHFQTFNTNRSHSITFSASDLISFWTHNKVYQMHVKFLLMYDVRCIPCTVYSVHTCINIFIQFVLLLLFESQHQVKYSMLTASESVQIDLIVQCVLCIYDPNPNLLTTISVRNIFQQFFFVADPFWDSSAEFRAHIRFNNNNALCAYFTQFHRFFFTLHSRQWNRCVSSMEFAK